MLSQPLHLMITLNSYTEIHLMITLNSYTEIHTSCNVVLYLMITLYQL